MQITDSTINIIDMNGKLVISKPTQVSLCSVNLFSGQMLVATRSKLVYLKTDGSSLETIAELDFPQDISCLDLALIGRFFNVIILNLKH